MLLRTLCPLVFLLFTIVIADDCGIGTEGGNVFIEYVNDIEMSKEHVTITMLKDSAIVKCKFWFYNKGTQKSRSVGFPNSWADPPQASTPLKNFRTWINGVETKVHMKYERVIEVEDDDTMPVTDKDWFVWTTEFKPNDTTVIENQYTANYSRCNGTREASIYYVLGTGRTWEGCIGKGTAVFDFKKMISTDWVEAPKAPDSSIQMKMNENTIEFTFANYEPGESDAFTVNFYSPWDTACCGQFDKKFSEFASKKPNSKLRIMRNEIFARHGYAFSDKDLESNFSKKPWYKKDPAFNMKAISQSELKTINELKAIEEKR